MLSLAVVTGLLLTPPQVGPSAIATSAFGPALSDSELGATTAGGLGVAAPTGGLPSMFAVNLLISTSTAPGSPISNLVLDTGSQSSSQALTELAVSFSLR